MKLVIDSTNTLLGSSLNLKISGFSIEVSDISSSGKVAIIDDSGKISIEVLPAPSVSNTLPEPMLENVQKLEKISKSVKIDKQQGSTTTGNVEKIQHLELLESEVSEVSSITSKLLFQKLVALRREIAQAVNLPPYIIFHDTTLKDMISKLPVDLDEMKEVSGVGQAKLEKYGIQFVDVIKKHLADSA
jgi:superfamily II DNA helicase RecQ